MGFELQIEIEKFRAFSGVRTSTGTFDLLGTDILRFVPHGTSGNRIRVGFLALIHGNEVVGLPVLNSILRDLADGRIQTPHEVYFGLGNVPAALANQRFIEKDLNRCFGRTEQTTAEDRRAREIEATLLDRVDYLIDLHQTVHAVLSPFFIFQYSSAACFSHLSLMNPGLTTILQFIAIGDSQNLSTDEYLRSRGRFGVALELGQKGYTDEMFLLGRSVCVDFLSRLSFKRRFDSPVQSVLSPAQFRFFEITGVFRSKCNGSELYPHWQNFTRFESGQALGETEGEPFHAEESGFVLFPRLHQKVPADQALFHVCKLVSADKLRILSRTFGSETLANA